MLLTCCVVWYFYLPFLLVLICMSFITSSVPKDHQTLLHLEVAIDSGVEIRGPEIQSPDTRAMVTVALLFASQLP